jgi:spore coat protein U-like protein
VIPLRQQPTAVLADKDGVIMKRLLSRLLPVLAGLLFAGSASAQSAFVDFTVQAAVAASCTIAATGINFGAYDPVGVNDVAPLDQSGTVTVRCTKGSIYNLTFDKYGGNMTGAVTSELLSYTIFSDAGRTVPWAAIGPITAPSRAAVARTVYGRVAGGQDVSVDSYSDTVRATVTY